GRVSQVVAVARGCARPGGMEQAREWIARPPSSAAINEQGANVADELLRVLVVDDEPSICRAFTLALAAAGYMALSAQTGDAALDIVRSEHIDVMVLDLRMGDMRGDTIFEHIAA